MRVKSRSWISSISLRYNTVTQKLNHLEKQHRGPDQSGR